MVGSRDISSPQIPETLLDPDLNFYRLQIWHESTEWYSQPRSKAKLPLSYRLTRDFLPEELQQRWGTLGLDSQKRPSFKSMAKHHHPTNITTKSVTITVPTTKLGDPFTTKFTGLFYYDADIWYFIKKYQHSLGRDPYYPFLFTHSDETDQIFWDLTYRGSNGESQLVYKTNETHVLGYEYRLTVHIPFQLGDTTLTIITDSSRYLSIDGRYDSISFRLEPFSNTLRQTLLRGVVPVQSVLFNYWLEYWKVVENRERWTYNLKSLITYYNQLYQIPTKGTHKVIPALYDWLFSYFATNRILPDYSASVSMINLKFDQIYRKFLANTDATGLLQPLPIFLSDTYRKRWCKRRTIVDPPCLVPTQHTVCSHNTTPPRRFGYVPSSQYSKYGNDVCLPYGKETYGYRATPNLRPFPYYYQKPLPGYQLGTLNERSASYHRLKQMLKLPKTNWKQSRNSPNIRNDTFHPLELTLNARNVPFQFPESVLNRLCVYILDYETTGTILSRSSDQNKRKLQLIKNRLVGNHHFTVNDPDTRQCTSVSMTNLRYFQASNPNHPLKYGNCDISTITYDGSIITHDGEEVVRILTTEPHPTLRTSDGTITLYRYQIVATDSVGVSSVLAELDPEQAIVTWYSDGEQVTTQLIEDSEGKDISPGWNLQHRIVAASDEIHMFPIKSVGARYHYYNSRLTPDRYPNIDHSEPLVWLESWFRSYVFYYQLFLDRYLINPFREAREYYQQVPTQLGIIDVSPREQLLPPNPTLSESDLCGTLDVRDPMGNHFPTRTAQPITYQERNYYRTFTPTSWDGCPWIKIKYLDKHGTTQTVNNYQNCQAVSVSGLDDAELNKQRAEPFTLQDMNYLDRWLQKRDQIRSEEPIIVIMAHNGNTTDFPLLVKQYQQFQLALPSNIVWIDTLFMMSSLIPIAAPIFNYPEDFHRMEVDEIDYLITKLIRQKKSQKPGYYFPNTLHDLLASSQLLITPESDESKTDDRGHRQLTDLDDTDTIDSECKHKILKTSMGKRGLGEANTFCFFQDSRLKGEHNAYCDVIGLWSIITDLFATVYEGVEPYREGSYNYVSEREFIITRIILHELMRSGED